MLDGDEVALAEVAGGAVAAGAAVVVRVELDEAVAAIAEQVSGSRPISSVSSRFTSATIDARIASSRGRRERVGDSPGRTGDFVALALEVGNLCPQRDELIVAVGGLTRTEIITQCEEEEGKSCR